MICSRSKARAEARSHAWERAPAWEEDVESLEGNGMANGLSALSSVELWAGFVRLALER
jgi:hypothetical protein